jgi:integrase
VKRENKVCSECGQHIKSIVFAEDIPTQQEILFKIGEMKFLPSGLTGKISDKMPKALIAVLYLYGMRVSEVVLGKDKSANAIRKKDFQPLLEHDKPFLYLNNIPTLKRRGSQGSKYPRNIAITIEKEGEFVNILYDYLDTLGDNDILFPFTRQRAFQICKVYDKKFYPHYFRHARACHLAMIYKFSAYQIKTWFNHGSIASSEYYVHLSAHDLTRNMI